MPRCRGLFCLAFTLLLFGGVRDPCFALSPARYTLLDRGRVVEVCAPNIVKVKLLGRDRLIAVRLLGVGSPRNRDRVKELTPEVLLYIQNNHLWETSRMYVASLLKDRVVEIWTRKWDRLDDKHRTLAYILIPWESAEKMDVNAEIIKSGMGFVTRDYLHVTFTSYRQLEQKAKMERRGIWQGLSCKQVSSLAAGPSE
jgi:hypothetical protein